MLSCLAHCSSSIERSVLNLNACRWYGALTDSHAVSSVSDTRKCSDAIGCQFAEAAALRRTD
eukprot:4402603-Amphidinium_carterae.2